MQGEDVRSGKTKRVIEESITALRAVQPCRYLAQKAEKACVDPVITQSALDSVLELLQIRPADVPAELSRYRADERIRVQGIERNGEFWIVAIMQST